MTGQSMLATFGHHPLAAHMFRVERVVGWNEAGIVANFAILAAWFGFGVAGATVWRQLDRAASAVALRAL